MKGIKSLLFVPAEERRLNKIGHTGADAYIIDLEDSVADDDKDAALERTVRFLRGRGTDNIFVRVNRRRYETEMKALQEFDVGFMLPKIETATDYAYAPELVKGRRVIALIETPRALINADSVASVPWISALAFGAEDFTVATNMRNSVDVLSIPKTMLVLAAKANRKQVYDTPCFRLQDEKAFDAELDRAAALGFDGKLAIHPKQVDKINRAFGLSDPRYIKHVIGVYEASGSAVCEIDGRVYEKLHIDRLRRLLAETD